MPFSAQAHPWAKGQIQPVGGAVQRGCITGGPWVRLVRLNSGPRGPRMRGEVYEGTTLWNNLKVED